MKHLFLAENDYAASGSAFAWALRSVGEEARYLAASHHEYDYPHQGEVVWSGNLRSEWRERYVEAMDWAEFVWVIQSELPFRLGGVYRGGFREHRRAYWYQYLQKKRVVLLHGGSYFRDNPEVYVERWKGNDVLSLCYSADLMGHFANEWLVVPPLDPGWLPQYGRRWNELRVGHYPSRPEDKGSEIILPVLREAGVKVRTSVNGRTVTRETWLSQLARMAECDVIVDQLKPELNGHTFGEWVSITTETAMMGRIPIANSLNPQAYKRTYGIWPELHICNTKHALIMEIERLKTLDDPEIRKEQAICRNWATSYHGLRPTGELLKKLCEIR